MLTPFCSVSTQLPFHTPHTPQKPHHICILKFEWYINPEPFRPFPDKHPPYLEIETLKIFEKNSVFPFPSKITILFTVVSTEVARVVVLIAVESVQWSFDHLNLWVMNELIF